MMYLNVLDEMSKNLEGLRQWKGLVMPGCIWRNTSPLSFFLMLKAKNVSGHRFKKNNDANAHMIPPHHAAPCSLSRVKFVYPISNQLQFTQQYMSHCVPPLSAKLKTVTL